MREITDILQSSKFIAGYKFIVFYLYDTLYSEKEYVKSGYHQIAKRFPEIKDMYEKLWSAFLSGEKAIDSVLIKEGIFSLKVQSECLNIYRNQKPDIQPYPGIKEMLFHLIKNGYQLGMITDGRPKSQKLKIEALDIKKFFKKIVITDELGGVEFRKPNKAAFLKMREYFDCPFSLMVYIGDNKAKDFVAPEQLGMGTIYFKNRDGIYASDGEV